MARVPDADRAEIDRQRVEGRLGAAVDGAGQVADERVRAVGLERLRRHPEGPAAGQRPEHGDRQYLGRHAEEDRDRSEDGDDGVDAAGGAEHADGDENRDQKGDDAQGDVEALLRSLDHRVVDADAAHPAVEDERGDERREDPERRHSAECVEG